MDRIVEELTRIRRNELLQASDDDLFDIAFEAVQEATADTIRSRAKDVYAELSRFVQREKMSPADRHYLNVYPVFIRAVVEQMVERQREMEMDLEPEERVPFVNFMDTIGRAHFEYLVEEMVEDAVKLAEDYT